MGNLQGKTIKIGSRSLLVQKLIAEGGFSFVFLVKDTANGKPFALKRVLAHDKEQLRVVQNEIKGDTTEVYILMEYCSGGHVVDLMNNRQSKRFSESEIINIFYDTCMAVAHMHSQDPPMAHRDLKVENILLDEHNGAFKLCDFGSVTTKTVCPSNKAEIAAVEEDIQKHTTMPYRAPEMLDFYQNKTISEKVDIWALGCVLYKLAFFTTPFEEGGALQILNVSYAIPAIPPYSAQLHNLIRFMLNPDPEDRPDIFDVLEEVCKLKGVPPPARKRPKQVRVPKSTPTEPKPAAHPTNTTTHKSSSSSGNMTPTAAAAASIFGPGPPSNNNFAPASTAAAAAAVSSFPSLQHSNHHPPAAAPVFLPLSPGATQPSPRSPARPQLTVAVPKPPPSAARRVRPGQHTPGDLRTIDESPLSSQQPHTEGVSGSVDAVHIVETCVKAATESSTALPDVIPIKRLSATTWETTNTTAFIFDAIMKRPLTDPIVCLKAFDLVLRLLHDGHRQVLVDIQACAQLFFNLHLGWGRHVERSPELATLLAQYALVIYHKVMLHQRLPQLDGLLVGDVDWSLELGMLVLDLVAKIFGLQPLLGYAAAQFNDLLAFSIIPVIQEVHAAYNVLVVCLQRLDSQQDDYKQLLPRVQTMFTLLQEFYTQIVSILPTLPSIMSFPTLPLALPINSNPDPFSNPTEAFNPFAESSSDPFFATTELNPPVTIISNLQPQSAPLDKPQPFFPRSSSLSSLVPTTPISPQESPIVQSGAPISAQQQTTVSLPSSSTATPNYPTTPALTNNNPFFNPLPGMDKLDLLSAPSNPFTSSVSAPSSPNLRQSNINQNNNFPPPLALSQQTSGDSSPRMLRTSSSLLSQPPASRRSTVHRRAQSSTTSDLARRTLHFNADPHISK